MLLFCTMHPTSDAKSDKKQFVFGQHDCIACGCMVPASTSGCMKPRDNHESSVPVVHE